MTSPPPPHDSTPPAGGGFGPPPQGYQGQGYQGQGPGPGQGYGQQPTDYGQAPGPYAAPGPQAYGPPSGFGPPQGGYGACPTPPPPGGGGPSGPKIAAIFIAVVLAAGLVVGGFLILQGSDGDEAIAGAEPHATPSDQDGQTDARQPTGSGDGAPSPGDLVPFVVLKPGQCFDHPALDPSVTRIVVRPCSADHDGEVIANKTLTGSYSTEQKLQEQALDLCDTAVAERLESIPEDGRDYYNYALYPSLDTYRIRQERRVSCALTLSNGPGGKKLTRPLPR